MVFVLLFIGGTVTVIIFIVGVKKKIEEAKNDIVNEVRKTELNLLSIMDKLEKDSEGIKKNWEGDRKEG